MATRVELPKETTRQALEMALASSRRGYNTAKQPSFKELHERDIKMWQTAIDSCVETK